MTSHQQDVVESVPIEAVGLQLPTISPSTSALLTRKASFGTPFSSAYSPIQETGSRRYSIDTFEPQSDGHDTSRTEDGQIRSSSATVGDDLRSCTTRFWSSGYLRDYSTGSLSTSFRRSATHGTSRQHRRHVSFADVNEDESHSSVGNDLSIDEQSDHGSEYTVAALKRDADDMVTPREDSDDDEIEKIEAMNQEGRKQRSESTDSRQQTENVDRLSHIPNSLHQSGIELSIPNPIISNYQHNATDGQRDFLEGEPDKKKTTKCGSVYSKKASGTYLVTPPCGLNRFVILVVCLLITVSTGSFFFNWPSTQQMLLNGGAYQWQCVSKSNDHDNLNNGQDEAADLSEHLRPPLIITPSSDEITEPPSLRSESWSIRDRDPSLIGSVGGPLIRLIDPTDNDGWRRYSLSASQSLARRLGDYLEQSKLEGVQHELSPAEYAKSSGGTSIRGGTRIQPSIEDVDIDAAAGQPRRLVEDRQAEIEEAYSNQQSEGSPPTHCTKQIQSINSLMPIGVAAWFCFSFIGGVLMDLCGPKLTAISGLMLSGSGWVTLAFCSQQVPIYMLALALIGCGVDVVFIGILNTSNLFPNYRGTIVSLFNAARSLAFAIPSVFNFMITSSSGIISFKISCFIYAGFIGLWAFVVYALVPSRAYPNLQSKSFIIQEEILDANDDAKDIKNNGSQGVDDKNGQMMEATSLLSHQNPFYTCSQCQSKLIPSNDSSTSLTGMESMTTLPSCAPDEHSSMDRVTGSSSFSSYQVAEIPAHPFNGRTCASCGRQQSNSAPEDKNDPDGNTNSSKNALVHRRSTVEIAEPPNHCIRGWTRALKTVELMKSSSYYPLIPLAVFTVLRGSFFSNTAMDQLGPFVHLFTILTPLSFIPAPVFGILADRLSIYFVFILLNSLGSVQFLLLLLSTSPFCLGIVTVLNLFISSFFLGQFYCYVTLSFPSEFTGTLVGITISAAGLFGLLVTPMAKFSMDSHNFQIMNGVCLMFALCSYIFIFLLWRASKSNPRALIIKSSFTAKPVPPSATPSSSFSYPLNDSLPLPSTSLSSEAFDRTPLHSIRASSKPISA